ncbi:MAG: hypothetical protein F4018_18320 [Acidobacteria bacterium]|nr:hypothetical protein [Acidobacteriota bacterium]MYK90134.1 hypothetical protein [Acidobacteriota bacterium]
MGSDFEKLFEGAELHEAAFLTVGTQVLVIRTLKPGATLDRAERNAFCTLAQRGFEVIVVRLNADQEPASALVAPAWRALDAPQAFDDITGADAVRQRIHSWLKDARRQALRPPPVAAPQRARTTTPPSTDATLLRTQSTA